MSLEDLKKQGEAPEWLEEKGFKTLSNGYMLEGETPKKMWRRVSDSSAKYLDKPELADKFFDLFWKGWLCGATPVLSNMGTSRGLPISCFSNHVGDSIDNIMMKARELALLSKYGGGVGIYMGDVRPAGSPISTGGTTEGTIPFAKIYDSTVAASNQGGVRRGAAAIYLPVEHGDAKSFLRIRRPEGDPNRQCLNMHHAVTLTDNFLQGALDGDEEKMKMLTEIYKTRIETGEPYCFFYDNVQKNRPQMYKDKNLEVAASNICLAGDTLVATSEGPKKIAELVGKEVEIFDGEKWVKNDKFQKTGVNQKLYRIHLSDGSFVDSTMDHRWFVCGEKLSEVRTKSLQKGMVLESSKLTNNVFEITEIEEIDSQDVYCTNVPSTSKFALANGLMTGNCSEIMLYTDPEHTFVCCLSSMNLAKWEEWKDTDAVYWSTWFLEGVMEEFIQKAEKISGFENAVRFAKKGRPIGLGVLGFHTLLQSEMTEFGSFRAKLLNKAIFKKMNEESLKASQDMAKEYSEPEWCKGYGVRNTHRHAVAPTASNSIISGNVSAGIEPINSNAYTKRSAKGVFLEYNPLLKKLLQEKGKDDDKTWKKIVTDSGSVRGLDFLTDEEKAVFKTAFEIDQMDLIQLAADRQQYICQGQSLNLFFSADVDPQYFHEVHIKAWQSGLNTLYYVRSSSVLKADLSDRDDCKACEG